MYLRKRRSRKVIVAMQMRKSPSIVIKSNRNESPGANDRDSTPDLLSVGQWAHANPAIDCWAPKKRCVCVRWPWLSHLSGKGASTGFSFHRSLVSAPATRPMPVTLGSWLLGLRLKDNSGTNEYWINEKWLHRECLELSESLLGARMLQFKNPCSEYGKENQRECPPLEYLVYLLTQYGALCSEEK